MEHIGFENGDNSMYCSHDCVAFELKWRGNYVADSFLKSYFLLGWLFKTTAHLVNDIEYWTFPKPLVQSEEKSHIIESHRTEHHFTLDIAVSVLWSSCQWNSIFSVRVHSIPKHSGDGRDYTPSESQGTKEGFRIKVTVNILWMETAFLLGEEKLLNVVWFCTDT